MVAASACVSASTTTKSKYGSGIESKAESGGSTLRSDCTNNLASMIRSLRARLAELEGPEMSPAFRPAEVAVSSDEHGGQSHTHSVECAEVSAPAADSVAHPTKQDISALPGNLETASKQQDQASADECQQFGVVVPPTVGLWAMRRQPCSDKFARSNRLLETPSVNPKARVKAQSACRCIDGLDTLCCNMPIRRQSDTLVRIFFSRHNRILPILHEPTFMQQYRWLWTSSSADLLSNTPQQCMGFCTQPGQLQLFLSIVNTVFALGVLFAEGSLQQNMAKAESFFTNGCRSDLLDTPSDDPMLEPVQLGLLMSSYLQCVEKLSKCWTVLGLTIRLAQSRGLPSSVFGAYQRRFVQGNISQLYREMRARLWCVCIVLDMYVLVQTW